MKNIYKGTIAFGIVALLAATFVAANGFGIGNAFNQMSDEEKSAAKTNMEAIRTAIQSNDYNAWKTAMEGQISMLKAQITEENFKAVVEKHALMEEAKESGDYKTMQELKSQNRMYKGNGQKKGLKQGNCPMASAE